MSWEDEFNKVEVRQTGTRTFTPVADGKYEAEITSCVIGDGTQGLPALEWEFTIRSGDFQNRRLWRSQKFDAVGIGYIKMNFSMLGLPCGTADEVKASVPKAIGKYVEINVKQKENPNNPDKPYMNVYINKALDTSTLKGIDETEEIPF